MTMEIQPLSAVVLTFVAILPIALALTVLAPTRGEVRLPIGDGADRPRRCGPRYRWMRGGAVAILVPAVLALDRHLAGEAATLWPHALETLGRLTAGSMIDALIPNALIDAAPLSGPALAVGAVVLLTSLRCRAALPLVMFMISAMIFALVVDGFAPRRSLTADSLATLVSATAVLQALCIAGGVALAPRLSAGTIAFAVFFAGAALVHRAAATQLCLMSWPVLADTGRLALAFSVVVFPATILALCALVGPSAHRARARAATAGIARST